MRAICFELLRGVSDKESVWLWCVWLVWCRLVVFCVVVSAAFVDRATRAISVVVARSSALGSLCNHCVCPIGLCIYNTMCSGHYAAGLHIFTCIVNIVYVVIDKSRSCSRCSRSRVLLRGSSMCYGMGIACLRCVMCRVCGLVCLFSPRAQQYNTLESSLCAVFLGTRACTGLLTHMQTTVHRCNYRELWNTHSGLDVVVIWKLAHFNIYVCNVMRLSTANVD